MLDCILNMDPQKRILVGINTQAGDLRTGEICTDDSRGRLISRQEQLRRQHLADQRESDRRERRELENFKRQVRRSFVRRKSQ